MNRREILGSLMAVTTTGLASSSAASAVSLAQGVQAAATNQLQSGPPGSRGLGSGARNLITDVPGLKIGQSQSEDVQTGVTVIIPDHAAVAACDVRGGGPATRETDALSPENLVQKVDAIVFAGGSVYGMAAADGVASWMGARNRGFALAAKPGVPPSPIVPTACLYDLANGGNKSWGENPPYRELGLEALKSVSTEFKLGTAGAGFGAMSGGLKGGTGSASVLASQGYQVGALVAVNSMGSAVTPGGRQFWAAPAEMNGEFGGLGSAKLTAPPENYGRAMRMRPSPRTNTTLACIATDIALSRVEAQRIAIMAQDGMARALRPIHAPYDGDVVFVLSTAQREAPVGVSRAFLTAQIGALAADVLARAIARAIFEATALPGSKIPAWRDLPGSG